MAVKKKATKQKTKKQILGERKPFMIVTDTGQAVKGDLLEKYASKSVQESRQIMEDPFTSIYGEMGLVTPLYDPSYLMNLAEVSTFHDICCDVKAQDIAGLGWSLKPVGDNPNTANYDKLTEFFNRVMVENPFVLAQRDKEEVGFCALELVRVADQPNAEPYNLYHIPAYTVRIHDSGVKFCQTRGNKYVWFKKLGEEGVLTSKTGSEFTAETNDSAATELLWNVKHTSLSTYYGRPPVIPAIRSIYGHISAMDYNIAFFSNYGIPAYAVYITGDYTDEPVDPEHPEGETKLQQAVKEKISEVQTNPHATMVFSVPSSGYGDGKVDIKFERLSVETKEASFRLYRADNRDEIVTAHRVDPHRINTYTTGPLGGDTAKISRQNYKESVQRPEQERWESLINHYIIQADTAKGGFGIEDWRFEFDSFDLQDKETELNLVKGLFSVGAITPNQIIEQYGKDYGLETVDGDETMDKHYILGTANVVEVVGSVAVQTNPDNTVKVLKQLEKDLREIVDEDSEKDVEGSAKILSNLKKRLRA